MALPGAQYSEVLAYTDVSICANGGVELKCQRDFSDIALVFNHLLDSFEPELRGKGAFSPTSLSMHHLTFTVLTLTGFRGVLNYRSTTCSDHRHWQIDDAGECGILMLPHIGVYH